MRILANTTSFHRSLKLLYFHLLSMGFISFNLLFHCPCHSSWMLSIIGRLRSLKGTTGSSFAVLFATSSANLFPSTAISAVIQKKLIFIPPFFNLLFFSYQHDFLFYSVNCWNELPYSARETMSLNSFKKSVQAIYLSTYT